MHKYLALIILSYLLLSCSYRSYKYIPNTYLTDKGVIIMRDDDITMSYLDSLVSFNHESKRQSRKKVINFCSICKQSDGAVSEMVSVNCLKCISNYPSILMKELDKDEELRHIFVLYLADELSYSSNNFKYIFSAYSKVHGKEKQRLLRLIDEVLNNIVSF